MIDKLIFFDEKKTPMISLDNNYGTRQNIEELIKQGFKIAINIKLIPRESITRTPTKSQRSQLDVITNVSMQLQIERFNTFLLNVTHIFLH